MSESCRYGVMGVGEIGRARLEFVGTENVAVRGWRLFVGRKVGSTSFDLVEERTLDETLMKEESVVVDNTIDTSRLERMHKSKNWRKSRLTR